VPARQALEGVANVLGLLASDVAAREFWAWKEGSWEARVRSPRVRE
jgi:hypothetical protein